jgi:serine/threonine protein kinase
MPLSGQLGELRRQLASMQPSDKEYARVRAVEESLADVLAELQTELRQLEASSTAAEALTARVTLAARLASAGGRPLSLSAAAVEPTQPVAAGDRCSIESFKWDNIPVALKRLPTSGSEVEASFLREQTILAQAPMGHPNLLRLFATVDDGPTRGLIFELFPRGSLAQFLRSSQPLEPSTAVRFAIAAIRGAAALHAVGIVHRAIRPAHLLLESDLSDAHLAGFGSAVRLEAMTEAVSLTPDRYTPPELVSLSPPSPSPSSSSSPSPSPSSSLPKPSPSADVWQLGLLAQQLATRRPPFAEREREREAVDALAAGEAPGSLGEEERERSPFLSSVAELALVLSPSSRPATAAAMLLLL